MEQQKRKSKKKSVPKDGSTSSFLEDDVPAAPTMDDFETKSITSNESFSGPTSLKNEFEILKENISCCSLDSKDENHECEFKKSDVKAVIATAPVDEGFSEISPSPVFSVTSQTSSEKPDLFQALINEGVCVLTTWNRTLTAVKEELSPHLTLYQKVDELVTTFVSAQSSIEKHELYELINQYKQSRSALSAALKDYSILQGKIEKLRNSIWIKQKVDICEEGACLDGVAVKARLEYPVAEYDQNCEKELKNSLRQTQHLIEEKITLGQSSCELHRMKIEHYFYSVTSCIGETDSAIDELKTCISILFSFLRQPIADQHCIGTFRHWLSQLIAILIAANHDDNPVLFVLNHLLRCPPGVSKWSSNFLQLPKACDERTFEENVLFLAVLMTHIAHRDLFLDDLRRSIENCQEENEENPWTFLDSEGEEEEGGQATVLMLSGSDLSMFIDQVDVSSIINHLFVISESEFTHEQIWKTFKRVWSLFRVLRSGLKLYCHERYRHFTKKVLRILKVLVQCLADFWQECLVQNKIASAITLGQLQDEFDSLFLAFCKAMKESECQGTWQIMSTLSYNCLTYDAIWRLYAQIHDTGQIIRDESILLSDPGFWPRFEEYLSLLSEAEIFSFLATLTGIALSRSIRGDDFIKLVAWELCEVGFVCTSTRDSAAKGARDLLCTLTSKFPYILSFLLDRMHGVKSSVGKLCLMLWKSLPLHLWSPTYDDLALLHQWLLSYNLSSLESHLSRLIIGQLDLNNHNLIDRLKQEVIGIIVIEACVKHVPEILPSSGIIGDSMRQVSSLASTVLQNQMSPVQVFQKWAWSFLARLKLHLMDESSERVSWTLANQREAFVVVPSYEQDVRFEPVRQAIDAKQPQAAYFALIATSCGHSVPEFCNVGIRHLLILASNGLFDEVLDIIHKVSPLFFQCPDSLYSSHEFITVMTQLLSEETGYMKFAKSMIVTQQMSQHVRRLAAIIEDHIVNARRYNLTTLLPVVTLWLETILCMPKWNTNRNALFILDVVLRAASFCEYSRRFAQKLFEDLVKAPPNNQDDRTLPKILGMIGPLGSKTLAHPLVPVQSLPDFPWLSFYVLSAYTALEQQQNSDLWRTFLKAYATGKYRTPEQSFKNAIAELDREVKPFCDLTLFRWIEAFLQLEVGHPLETIYLQQFFMLYLERAPKAGPTDVTGAHGFKIFEASHESDLLKKAVTRLKDQIESLKTRLTSGSFPSFEEKQHVNYLLSVYEAYLKWLEDKNLMDATTYLPNLPRAYLPEKLLEIFSKSAMIWLDTLDLAAIREDRSALLSFWTDYKLSTSTRKVQRPASSKPELSFQEKLNDRLATLPKPLPPPRFEALKLILPEFRLEMLAKPKSLTAFLLPYLRALADHASLFSRKIGQLNALNCSLLELLPLEFKEEKKTVTKVQPCGGVFEEVEKGKKMKSPCCGGAAITFEYVQSVEDVLIRSKKNQNREDYDILLAKLLESPPPGVVVATLALENSIRFLRHAQLRAKSSSSQLSEPLAAVGAYFFFFLLDYFNEDLKAHAPSARLFSTCLESLGEDFISKRPKQCLEIVTRLASGGEGSAAFLAPHFSPLGPSNEESGKNDDFFVETYKMCLDLLFDKPHVLFSVITKFDIPTWLVSCEPPPNSQIELLRICFLAFEKFGPKPDEEARMNFEVMRRHYRTILSNGFPQHYIPCLRLLLESSSSQAMTVEIWYDFLNVISNGVIKLKQNVAFSVLKKDVARFMTEQEHLRLKEALETIDVLVGHFSTERQSYGLYGLYPRYRPYIEPISAFLYITGKILCLTTIDINRATSTETLIDRLWPLMRDLYAPWICTYSPNFVRQSCASWIQQLSDDRLRLLPWISTDAPLAANLMKGFLDIIEMLGDLLPSEQGVMSYVFLFYIENICHPGVRNHVSDVYHSGLSTLSWEKYSPTIDDLELMICNINLPDTNNFFATLLVLVKWKDVLSSLMNVQGQAVFVKGLGLLLIFAVRLSSSRVLREEYLSKYLSLLSDLCHYPWYSVDVRTIDEASHWLAATIDPNISLTHDDCHPVDKALWRLFGFATTVVKSSDGQQSETHSKRQIYVRCWSCLVVSATNKNPRLVVEKENVVMLRLKEVLEMIEAAVISNINKKELYVMEMSTVLPEFFVVMKEASDFGRVCSIVTRRWLSSRPPGHFALIATLNVAASAYIQPKFLAEILETCLEAQFEPSGESSLTSATWDGLLPLVHLPDSLRIGSFLTAAVESSSFLCLYVYFSKKVDATTSLEDCLVMLGVYCKWLKMAAVSESVEPKFLLLLSHILVILHRITRLDFVPSVNILLDHLSGISDCFLSLSEAQSSWNLLSRFRSSKTTLTNRGKLLSYIVLFYVFNSLERICRDRNLPNMESERLQVLFKCWTEKVTGVKGNKVFSDLLPIATDAINVIDNAAVSFNHWKDVWLTVTKVFKNRYLFCV